MKLPIIKKFKSDNIINAFVLGSILQSIIFSLAFVLKDYIDKLNINKIINFIISVIFIFVITLMSYFIMYMLFDFGGGMLIN